jgi:hypothetical protein
VAEQAARAAGYGIWRGDFVPPWEWREGVRLPSEPRQPVQVCDVKGIVTDGGNRVFVVPTDPQYEKTIVDPNKGERLFCSDDEARLAGWRHYGR